MSWRDRQLVGLSIQKPKELKRITALNVVNMVEIKVQQFSKDKDGFPLYLYKDGYFYPDDNALKKLSFELCDSLEAVQFHLAMGGSVNPKIESGLNIGVIAHHEIYLRMFQMFEEIYGNHKIGSVLTLHPPLFKAKKKYLLHETEAIRNAEIFFAKLDELRIAGNHQTKIGLENMPDPGVYGLIGYLPAHFRAMLWDTRSIGVTIDTGHRRLAKDFKVSEFIRLGFEVVNCHFHGNRGKSNSNSSLSDDIHEFPHSETDGSKENVKGYENYIRYYRRHRTPVVLEISHLEKYSDAELIEKVEQIKRDLE